MNNELKPLYDVLRVGRVRKALGLETTAKLYDAARDLSSGPGSNPKVRKVVRKIVRILVKAVFNRSDWG